MLGHQRLGQADPSAISKRDIGSISRTEAAKWSAHRLMPAWR